MKLTELNLNPVAKIRESTNFTVREVKKVCKNIGPRPSASENEDKAQDYIIENCGKFADEVKKEPFTTAPRAFLSWPWVCAILMMVSTGLYIGAFFAQSALPEPALLVMRAVGLALNILCIFFIVFEFLLYKQVLDVFFKKRPSSNVVLTRKPKGEVKRRIVFAGHVDSSYEWRYTRLGGAKLLTAVIVWAIICIAVSLVADILTLAVDLPEPIQLALVIAQGVCFVGVSVGYFFEDGKHPVDGANDNLTGVFASISVLQFLSFNNIELENTEVVAVSMGCEEAGLRGSKAFAKAHDYNDVETVCIAVDTLRDFAYMGVFNKDMSGTAKHDKQAVALLQKASQMAELDLPLKSVFFGSSDAAALTQGGMKAALLAAMDPAPARYYHTRLDTADNMDIRTVEKGVETLIHATLLFDEQGLRDSYEA